MPGLSACARGVRTPASPPPLGGSRCLRPEFHPMPRPWTGNKAFSGQPASGGRAMSRVAMVTGGSRGIGRGIVLALAGIGYDIVLDYAANETAARQTAKESAAAAREAGFAVDVEVCQADVASAADRQRLVECARERFGRLDLLVNNAGV